MKIKYIFIVLLIGLILTEASAKSLFTIQGVRKRLSNLQIKYGKDIILSPEKLAKQDSEKDDDYVPSKKEIAQKKAIQRNSFYNKVVSLKGLYIGEIKSGRVLFRDKADGRALFTIAEEVKEKFERQVMKNKGKKFIVKGRFKKIGDYIVLEFINAKVLH